MKTNEQIACNNWEKIGMIKERERILKVIKDKFKDFDDKNKWGDWTNCQTIVGLQRRDVHGAIKL